jgi:hypothetical protein
VFADATACPKTVEVRHQHVENDDIGDVAVLESLDCLGAIVGDLDAVAFECKGPRQGLPKRSVIVDDEDASRCRIHDDQPDAPGAYLAQAALAFLNADWLFDWPNVTPCCFRQVVYFLNAALF